MKRRWNYLITAALLGLAIFLMGADGGGAAGDERASLEKQAQALRKRIEALKREQDFLLFQKTMDASDSKYLIIDIKRKAGQLRYKNRLLKDFRFRTSRNFPGSALQPGVVAVTKKAEGKKDRYALVLGNALVVKGTQTKVAPGTAGLPSITLTRKEMASVFYALEEGSMAYLER